MEKRKMNERVKKIIAMCICILLAFGLWIYVMSVESPAYEQLFGGVTIDLTGDDALAEHGLALFSGYGNQVDVTLAGKKSVLSKLTADSIIVSADLSQVKTSGRYTCRLKVDVPAGCKLIGMSQENLSVYVDESAQTIVELHEERQNVNLPDGCFTGEIDLTVDRVTVSGPAGVLEKVSGALVTLDMADVTKSTTLHEKIYLTDNSGEILENPYLSYYPTEISVDVPIMKTVTVPLEIIFKNRFLDYSNTDIYLEPASVEVTGESGLIAKGDLVEPILIDEKTAFYSERFHRVVGIEAVEGVELSTSRASVTLTLGADYGLKTLEIPEENITEINAANDKNYHMSNPDTEVTLLGKKEVLAQIKAENVSLIVDMGAYSDASTGTVRVKESVAVSAVFADDVLPIGSYYVSVTFDD